MRVEGKDLGPKPLSPKAELLLSQLKTKYKIGDEIPISELNSDPRVIMELLNEHLEGTKISKGVAYYKLTGR